MSRLQREKLHVSLAPGTGAEGPVTPRAYTLTHSDLTGDLFLTIGSDYNRGQYADLYTRLMRDEVLAEWTSTRDTFILHVHCHVSGRLPTVGSARLRLAIFRRELPLVLEALRAGDHRLFETHRELDQAPILVHCHARQPNYHRAEQWGVPGDYHSVQQRKVGAP
jgi:hypothetical protein